MVVAFARKSAEYMCDTECRLGRSITRPVFRQVKTPRG